MNDLYQELEKKLGKPIDLCVKSTYNPKTKTVLRALAVVHPRSRQLSPGSLRPGRAAERPQDLGRGPERGREDQEGHRPSGRYRPRPGDRHRDGHADDHVRVGRPRAGPGGQPDAQVEADARRAEVREGPLRGDHDGGGLHLGRVVQQSRGGLRQGLPGAERHLDDAHGGEREPGDVAPDPADEGAAGTGPRHRPRARHAVLRRLEVRGERRRRQEVPDRLRDELPRRFRRRRVLRLPVLPEDGPGPRQAHRERPEGSPARQVQGPR